MFLRSLEISAGATSATSAGVDAGASAAELALGPPLAALQC